MRGVDFDDLLKRLQRNARDGTTAAEDDAGPRAAVAAVLRPGPDAGEILFIRRAEREGDPWSGHMAFPGGRRDTADPTLLSTAIRETNEELALDLGRHGDLVARLPGVQAMSKSKALDLVVVPFVFVVRGNVALTPNEEVAETLWAPLGPLLRGEGRKPFPYDWNGVIYQLPSFEIEGRIVWGLTHRMLESLSEVVR